MGKSCPGKGGFESAGVSSTSTPTSTWKPGATTQRCAADTTVGEATQLLNQYSTFWTDPGWLVTPAWLAQLLLRPMGSYLHQLLRTAMSSSKSDEEPGHHTGLLAQVLADAADMRRASAAAKTESESKSEPCGCPCVLWQAQGDVIGRPDCHIRGVD